MPAAIHHPSAAIGKSCLIPVSGRRRQVRPAVSRAPAAVFVLCWLFPGLLLGVGGCGSGSGRVPVSGRVLLDGQPLTTGKIIVAPANDRPAFGEIDSRGCFTLTTEREGDGCIVGTHRVAVSATDRTNPNQVRWLVPSKYADLFTSELTAEIRGPTKDLVIELKQSYEDPSARILVEQGDVVPNQAAPTNK